MKRKWNVGDNPILFDAEHYEGMLKDIDEMCAQPGVTVERLQTALQDLKIQMLPFVHRTTAVALIFDDAPGEFMKGFAHLAVDKNGKPLGTPQNKMVMVLMKFLQSEEGHKLLRDWAEKAGMG